MEYPISYKRYLDQGRCLFTDSRQVIDDGIFIALHGKNFDGNAYAMDALEKGAAYAIVDKAIGNDSRLILVEDTLQELQSMAALNRKINKAKIIAITGSNGKTTTKELSYSIFHLASKCIATQGNLNNHIGVPLTLLRIAEDTEFAIIEMGANQPGDIKELCRIADPEIGLITNIGKAHLQGFGSLDGVVKTKFELFDFLTEHHGICIYNMSSELINNKYKSAVGIITYGDRNETLDFFGNLNRSFPTIEMKFNNHKDEITITSSLFGEYNYQNMLSSATLASICGMSMQQIKEGIESYVPANMRSQIIHMDSNVIFLDAYNANPSSMKATIEIFNQMAFHSKWVILGEMAELGEYKATEHENLVKDVLSMNFDKTIFVGKAYDSFKNQSGLQVFDELLDCKRWLNMYWPSETAILIKGSRSSYLEKLIH